MAAYVLRRVLGAIVLMFLVSIVTFYLIHRAPGGPALLSNPDLTQSQVQEFTEALELDDPLYSQYFRWLKHAIRGDFGNSYSTIKPVTEVISERLPNTAILAFSAIGLSILLAVPLGVISAVRRDSLLDRVITSFSFLGTSIPVFWLGIMLIVLFSLRLDWLPSGGMRSTGQPFSVSDRLSHLVLPMTVLAVSNLAELTRYMRSGMITVLQEDYMRTARSKGLSERRVLRVHGLKNALIPIITVIGIMIPRAMGSAAVTETVFSWPGMGRLAVESATSRDYPVVIGATLTIALITVTCSLITDLLYGVLDPRIRMS
ncbi:MAG: ABC transporter permease [Thermomicrobiales bacterium]|nr:ABC transporter permease [Thermomicrobiales bacterium]